MKAVPRRPSLLGMLFAEKAWTDCKMHCFSVQNANFLFYAGDAFAKEESRVINIGDPEGPPRLVSDP